MNMIEKVALPGPLVTSLMTEMLKVTGSSGCEGAVKPSCRCMVMTPLVGSLVFMQVMARLSCIVHACSNSNELWLLALFERWVAPAR